jgi:uncharacterized C2H2 Zn-finger protein
MPKIKVYKGNRAIIPVEDAKVATAFKCPWTNEIFSTKKSYVTHLKVLREDRIHRAIRARIQRKVFEELINQPSFEKIIEWIETHPEFFFDRLIHTARDGWRDRREHLRDKFWIKMTYLDVSWSNSVSNSHSCPRGGTTNWAGRNTLKDGSPAPRGYPGWRGRIEFQLSHDLGFGSDVFRNIGIHTGTGGGSGISNNRYGYDVKFFASDWPGLEKNRIFEILKNERPASFSCGEPNYFSF